MAKRTKSKGLSRAARTLSAGSFARFVGAKRGGKKRGGKKGKIGMSADQAPGKRHKRRKSSGGLKKSPGGKHACGCMLGLKGR